MNEATAYSAEKVAQPAAHGMKSYSPRTLLTYRRPYEPVLVFHKLHSYVMRIDARRLAFLCNPRCCDVLPRNVSGVDRLYRGACRERVEAMTSMDNAPFLFIMNIQVSLVYLC